MSYVVYSNEQSGWVANSSIPVSGSVKLTFTGSLHGTYGRQKPYVFKEKGAAEAIAFICNGEVETKEAAEHGKR